MPSCEKVALWPETISRNKKINTTNVRETALCFFMIITFHSILRLGNLRLLPGGSSDCLLRSPLQVKPRGEITRAHEKTATSFHD
jgi:hypothetical protein